MGILSSVLLLPFKGPADGTIWVARKLAEAAEQQRNDPGMLKSALIDAEKKLLSGELSEEEYDEIETEILTRLRAAK